MANHYKLAVKLRRLATQIENAKNEVLEINRAQANNGWPLSPAAISLNSAVKRLRAYADEIKPRKSKR